MVKSNVCNVLVPTSAIGIGIDQKSFEHGIQLKPDVIACDAGSTDSGPYYLGMGKSKYANEAVKKDMRVMMIAASKLSIPVIIGSAGTCGVNQNVDTLKDICHEISREMNLELKIATIYSQQDEQVLVKKYNEGKIIPLQSAPPITQDTFKECSNIVALIGAEPFIQALNNGADIIIAGRATDTAMLACVPLMKGCHPGAAWHAAKVAECGPICTTNPLKGGVFFTVDEKGFSIRPTAEKEACTPHTVSSHMLYENSDPHHLVEPSGITYAENATYTQLDEKTVRVEHSEFIPTTQYTMKLEGAGPIGFQTIILLGIQDPYTLSQINKWKEELIKYVSNKLDKLDFAKDTYSFDIKLYGYSAVSGDYIQNDSYIPREVGVLLTTTGETQEIATKVAKVFNPNLLHFSLDEEDFPSFAFSSSPAEIEKGQIFEFKLNHVVEADDPFELIQIQYWNSDGSMSGREKHD